MGLRLLLLGFCLLITDSAQSASQPHWTKKFHSEAVRSASIRDSLGVSNDRTSIVVWKADSGDSVASFPATRGDFQQVWLSADLLSVVAVTRENAQTPACIYWISLATGVVTDSLDVPRPTFITPYPGYPTTSDISEDGRQLIVTVYCVVSNPPNYTTGYVPTVIDLMSRSVKTQLAMSGNYNRRFESHDKRIAAFYQHQPSDSTWSPSGLVAFDGTSLLGYPVAGERTKVTDRAWTTIRWTQSDAVILGKAYPYDAGGAVCLVNLCSGEVIDTVVDSSYKDWAVWSHSDMRRCLTYGPGEVAFWDIPSFPRNDAPCVRNTFPDTVVTDSVYKISSVWFPFSSSVHHVLRDEADAAPYTTSLFAWHNGGATNIRFGRIDGTDTSWAERRALFVAPRKHGSTGTLVLSTGKGAISHLHTMREDQILVSTLAGMTLIVDTSLRCTRGFYSSDEHRAAVWNGDSSLLILQTRASWSGNGPSFHVGLEGIVRNVGLRDFVLRDSLKGAYASGTFRYDEPYHPQFGLLDAQGTEALWHAVAFNSLSQDYGTICEVRSQPLSTVSHMYPWTDLPVSRQYLGVPIGGAINSSGSHILTLQRSVNYAFGQPSRVVAIETARDTAVASFDKNYSEHAMFIIDNICIIDSMILDVPSLFVRTRHSFKGPFAKSIPQGYAVIWDTGMFHYLDVNGSIAYSTPGPIDRPTVLRVLRSGTIMCGHADGTVRTFAGKVLASNTPTTPTSPSVNYYSILTYPQPSSSTVVVKTNLPPDEPLTTLTLCDNTGRTVMQRQERSAYEYAFDVAQGMTAVPPGVYGLRIMCGTHVASTFLTVVR